MVGYLKEPGFWFALIVAALVINWAYMKFFGGQGKLV
jgi:hypothetical protein